MWQNGSGDSAEGLLAFAKLEVTGSIPGVSHKFRIAMIIIRAYLIKQPNNTLSRMYVQTHTRARVN